MAIDQETLTALTTLLDQKMATQAPSAAPNPYGLPPQGGQMAPLPLVPTSISFRIKVPLPDGREASGYLHFSTENCQTPQAIQMMAASIAQQYPIEAFMPRNQGGWGGGGQQGGGFGGNRGGYGGGAGYGGGRGRW